MRLDLDQPGVRTACDEYAEALLSLAERPELAEQVDEELSALVELVGREPMVAEFLASSFVTPAQKEQALRTALGGRAGELTGNFLGVLVRNGRGAMLPAVARRFRVLKNRRDGKVEVSVASPRPLEEDQRLALVAALREVLGGEPLLQTHVDEDLLGGLRVKVGDKVMDGSLKAQLERMRRQLRAHPDGQRGSSPERPR